MFSRKSILTVVFALASSALSVGVEVLGYSDSACASQTGDIQLTLNECQALPAIASSYIVNSNDQGTDNVCTDGYLVVQGWQASADCSDGEPDISIGPVSTDPTPGGCGIARIQSVKLFCHGYY